MLLLSFRVFRNNAHVLRKSQRLILKCVTLHACPGKNIRWDPANPTWDPRCVPGWDPGWDYGKSCMGSHLGLWNILHGIPPGIMEHPAWDLTWDYGTSRMGSHLGLWNIPHGIPPGIMEHPAWDPTWDPAN